MTKISNLTKNINVDKKCQCWQTCKFKVLESITVVKSESCQQNTHFFLPSQIENDAVKIKMKRKQTNSTNFMFVPSAATQHHVCQIISFTIFIRNTRNNRNTIITWITRIPIFTRIVKFIRISRFASFTILNKITILTWITRIAINTRITTFTKVTRFIESSYSLESPHSVKSPVLPY